MTYLRAVELAENAEAAAKGQKEMRSPFKPADAALLVQVIKAGKKDATSVTVAQSQDIQSRPVSLRTKCVTTVRKEDTLLEHAKAR